MGSRWKEGVIRKERGGNSDVTIKRTWVRAKGYLNVFTVGNKDLKNKMVSLVAMLRALEAYLLSSIEIPRILQGIIVLHSKESS